jgi:hypothetical protein
MTDLTAEGRKVMAKHKLRVVAPNRAAGGGKWVALECGTCGVAVQSRTRAGAEALHDARLADPERLAQSQSRLRRS